MKIFLWNIIWALMWAAVTEQFTPSNLIVGFGVGYLVLWFVQRNTNSSYFHKVGQAIDIVLFFFKELVVANIRMAHNVIKPIKHLKSGIVAVRLDAKTDLEITVLANLITLTPGSFSLDVSDDRKMLYIHAMNVEDPHQFQEDIKNGFEQRVLEILR